MTAPWVNVGVIALSAIFEGLSFRTARREMRARFARESLWTAVTAQGSGHFAIILEDGAALIGLGIALVGVVASGFLGWTQGDGVARWTIGCLLIATAGVLFRETRSLLTGESASPRVIEQARAILIADPRVVRIERMRACSTRSRHGAARRHPRSRPDLTGDGLRRATADLRAAIRHGLPASRISISSFRCTSTRGGRAPGKNRLKNLERAGTGRHIPRCRSVPGARAVPTLHRHLGRFAHTGAGNQIRAVGSKPQAVRHSAGGDRSARDRGDRLILVEALVDHAVEAVIHLGDRQAARLPALATKKQRAIRLRGGLERGLGGWWGFSAVSSMKLPALAAPRKWAK